MKKNYARIALAIFVIAILFACRQESLTIEENKSSREIDFFKSAHEKTSRFKEGSFIVGLLEKENDDTHFVTKLKDKKGLPIWDKMIMATTPGASNKTSSVSDTLNFAIPLTEDKEFLSSVIIVTVVDQQVRGIKNIDNTDLYNYVNDASIPVIDRENAMMSFIYLDHKSFGTYKYINIPVDLFPEIELRNAETKKSMTISSVSDDSGTNSFMALLCVTYVEYCQHCNGDVIEGYHTKCFSVWVEGGGGGSGGGTGGTGGGDGGGGDGGGGDGGGGNPGSGGNCANRGVFYRIEPEGCGGGGSNDNEMPCENIKNKQKDSKYAEKYNALNQSSIFSMNRERGFFERQSPPANNAGSTFIQLDGPEGSSGLGLPDNVAGIVGLLHSHNDEDGVIKIFSPTDVRTFINHFMPQANSYLGSYSQAYTTVVTSFGSYTLQFTEGVHPGGINYNTWEQWNAWYKNNYRNLIDNENLTKANIEKVFTQFLKEVVNINGLEVYRVTKNTAVRLEYNGKDNPVKETPCPVITP